MAEDDRDAPPAAVRKCPGVGVGAVMGVDDEALDAHGDEVIHGTGDHGAARHRQKGLRAVFRKGPKAFAQTGPQNEGRSDSVRIQWRTSARFVPNSGSIRIRATTAKPGTVERMIHRKKCG